MTPGVLAINAGVGGGSPHFSDVVRGLQATQMCPYIKASSPGSIVEVLLDVLTSSRDRDMSMLYGMCHRHCKMRRTQVNRGYVVRPWNKRHKLVTSIPRDPDESCPLG
jgi:hypothetical protein